VKRALVATAVLRLDPATRRCEVTRRTYSTMKASHTTSRHEEVEKSWPRSASTHTHIHKTYTHTIQRD
jgi:hypothetical protein